MNAAIRIVYNSENGDLLLMIPKLKDRQTIDFALHSRMVEQLLRQLGQEPPEIDPRNVNSPRRLIRFIRFPTE